MYIHSRLWFIHSLPFINSINIYSPAPLLGRSKCLKCGHFSQRAHSVKWEINTNSTVCTRRFTGNIEAEESRSLCEKVESFWWISSGFGYCIACVCKVSSKIEEIIEYMPHCYIIVTFSRKRIWPSGIPWVKRPLINLINIFLKFTNICYSRTAFIYSSK